MMPTARNRNRRPSRLRQLWRAVAVIVPLFAATPSAAAVAVDLALVLAVDISDSIDVNEGLLQRRGYVDAFKSPEIQQAIKNGRHGRIAVAYFEWADVSLQSLVVDWMIIDGPDTARKFGETLDAFTTHGGHFTSISAAIQYALSLLKRSPYEATRQVIDISGDGRNNDGPPLRSAREAAATWGVTINGLPIDNERSRIASDLMPGEISRYYRERVIIGPGAFIVEAKDFEDFGRAISRKLLREIANLPPPEDGAAYRPAAAGGTDHTADPMRPPSTRQTLPVQ